MTKQFLTIALVAMVLMTACNQKTIKENPGKTKTETITTDSENIISQSLTDKNGNTLKMTFDNAKDIVTVDFEGEKTELIRKRAASGIWYANDRFELRGKGNDIQFRKDGKLIFEHQDN
ncbi:MliC family protein [Sunxiuqinia rutila]|uniref:MliC family protein n=1 Tax=Sunxiuqinia rutila TaxID=1397841 RepID=UPI003D361D19